MAELLALGKEESARIRVENIVREDIYIELLEMLELYCELLLARIALLEKKECDPGLEEAVKTVIYAAPHTDVKELGAVRDMLVHKYGPEFTHAALANEDGIVPDKVVKRAVVQAPSTELVSLYLREIARAYDVPFSEIDDEEAEEDEGDDDEDGGKPILLEDTSDVPAQHIGTPRRLSSQLPDPDASTSPISVRPPGKSSDNPHPVVKIPQDVAPQVARQRKSSTSELRRKEDDDLDSLRRRFEALKR